MGSENQNDIHIGTEIQTVINQTENLVIPLLCAPI